MTDKEAFEAWFCGLYGRIDGVFEPGAYTDSHTHVAWTAWQAAAAAERERCAKVCEDVSMEGLPEDPPPCGPELDGHIRQIVCGVMCADAIRNGQAI